VMGIVQVVVVGEGRSVISKDLLVLYFGILKLLDNDTSVCCYRLRSSSVGCRP
jgi:hypothetical protein